MTDRAMIDRRVRAGYNRTESVALLAKLREAHTADNLAYALAYNAFTK